MENSEQHDIVTVCAIAVIAMCAATFAHEAAGHGAACLAAGGRITKLTSVYFDCSAMTGMTALAGPLGNLAAALLGWTALRMLSDSTVRLRLGALLLTAFSVFWAAGYLIYAMAGKHGDYALAAHELLPLPPQVWRAAGIIIGIALYMGSIGLITRETDRIVGSNGAPVLRVAWLSATAAAIAAAAFYRPDPVGAIIQAGLEIGAASVPMLYLGRKCQGPAKPVAASIPWIASAAMALALFVFSLGRGLV